MSKRKIFYCLHEFDEIIYYWDEKLNPITEVYAFNGTGVMNIVPKDLMKHLNIPFLEWDLPEDLSNDIAKHHSKGKCEIFTDVIRPYILKNTMNPNQINLF